MTCAFLACTKYYMSQKNDGIFQIFDQIKVQEYRSESGIAIYAWVIW